MWYPGQREEKKVQIPSKNTFIHFAPPSCDELPAPCFEDDSEIFAGNFRRQQSEPVPSLRRRGSKQGATSLALKVPQERDESEDGESTDDASLDIEPELEPMCRQETEVCWPTYDYTNSAPGTVDELPPMTTKLSEVWWPASYPPGSAVAPNQVDLTGNHASPTEETPTVSMPVDGTTAGATSEQGYWFMVPTPMPMPMVVENPVENQKTRRHRGRSLIDKAMKEQVRQQQQPQQLQQAQYQQQLQQQQMLIQHHMQQQMQYLQGQHQEKTGSAAARGAKADKTAGTTEQSSTTSCNNCGAAVQPRFRFCSYCGHKQY
jgi:hypothetical protein